LKGKLNGSFQDYLVHLRLLDTVQSITPKSWAKYIGNFGNWVHFHDHIKWDNNNVIGPLQMHWDPPFFNKLRERQRNFAAWEKWKGNTGQTIGTVNAGFWKVFQALFPPLQPLKALADNAIKMTRVAADRTNRSRAKPILMIHYAAIKKIYLFYTEVDAAGHPIYGVEPYTGSGFW